MDNKAFYKLSYGVFMLSTKLGDKVNGCITNTCIQVANSPTRLSVAVLNSNYTCELMKESGIFNVSVLDKRCNFDIIKHFGYQSGRDVDKFKDIICPRDDRGVPYLQWGACSMFACKITEMIDLGSHTLFLAELTDAQVLSKDDSCTYEYYQSHIKPQPQTSATKKRTWTCSVCGYVYEGDELPDDFVCPLCKHGKEDFVLS